MISGRASGVVGSGSIAFFTVLLALPKLLVISSLAGAYIAPIAAVSSSTRSSSTLAVAGRHIAAKTDNPGMRRPKSGVMTAASSPEDSCADSGFPDAMESEGGLLDTPNFAPGASADEPAMGAVSSAKRMRLVQVKEVEAPNVWNLPNVITMARVVAIPIFAAAFYAASPRRNVWCAGIFAGAALTDWLDGFLARKMGIESPFGAFLDPVADKLMVSTALILLSERLGSWMTICSAIILCRELTISALREWMAQLGLRETVKVGIAGKWKTATQMVAITLLLLLQPGSTYTLLHAPTFMPLAKTLLFVSTVLTVTSGSSYLRAAWPTLVGRAKDES